MRYILFLLIVILLQSCSTSKLTYLNKNRFDLHSKQFEFPQKNFKIIGFGAYHGSQKTEDVEITLIKSLIKSKSIKYYLPETDFSIAHYFNKYLQTGDTVLLKDLVTTYGMRVPQERTIQVYEKWKELKRINDQLPEIDKIKVIGIDFQVNYKYVSRHIIELFNKSINLKPLQDIRNMVAIDTTGYELGDLSYSYQVLHRFVTDYERHKSEYNKELNNKEAFTHIIKNLKISFDLSNVSRDKIMFENYVALNSIYNFKAQPQFLRMGFSHIEKSREGTAGYPYFFTQLIENKFYKKNEVISIIGYLTDSKVLWDELYDDNGAYKGFTVEAGYGIGDYEKEYFRGIDKLKEQKVSDMTLFKLNKKRSPYHEKSPDLIEVIMKEEASNGANVKGTATTDYLDYAILISNSKPSKPIYELNK